MDYLYTPKFAQPKNLINNDNNYFPLPFKYATKPLKNSNCKEVKQNLKNFYCLTERISLISEQNKLNRISTENTSSSLSNSKKHHEQFNYYKTLNNHNRIMIPHTKSIIPSSSHKYQFGTPFLTLAAMLMMLILDNIIQIPSAIANTVDKIFGIATRISPTIINNMPDIML